ncbi:MAG: hypothetical protein QW253_03720 [Metallosphaera sp.]
MELNDKLFEDARFYNKLIAIVLSKEDFISQRIKGTPLERKVFPVHKDPEEYPDYLVRVTRGVIPAISLITPDLELVGIIESNDPDYSIGSLKDVVNKFEAGKITPVKIPEYAPEPLEPSEASIYDAMNKVIDGVAADFRVVELISAISKIEKRYPIVHFIKPQDEIASYLLGKGEPGEGFSVYEAVKVIKGDHDVLEDYIEKEGKVYRSKKKENWGILVDESIAGYALLLKYMRQGKSSFLDRATEIKDFIKRNLETEKGFRDTIVKDPLTRLTFLEPLANAEASIFLSALWQATGDEEVRKMALKALGIATVRSDYLGVAARIAHSLLRLNHGILTSKPGNYNDIRIMLNEKIECDFKQGDVCKSKLEDFNGLEPDE